MAEFFKKINGFTTRDRKTHVVNQVAANHDDVQDYLARLTFAYGVAAQEILRQHRQEGRAHIEVDHLDVDWYVILADDDPMNDESDSGNALAIEFGRAGYIDQDGLIWGESPALGVLTEATGAVKPRKRVKRKRRKRNLRG